MYRGQDMNISSLVTEYKYSRQATPVLITVLAAMVLYGMPSLLHAADLSVRVYERGGKLPLQDVSVCLGTPASINQFGTASTGADGMATFTNIPGAQLVVTASKSGYKAEQQSLVTNNIDRLLVISLPTGGGGPVCGSDSGRKITGSSSIRVSQFRINKGVALTATPQVFLNHNAEGVPTHYRASERSDFSGADWQIYAADPGFELSPGNGRKLVYFQLRRFSDMSGANLEVLTPVVQDTITLQQR
jgi:hypothetical protein